MDCVNIQKWTSILFLLFLSVGCASDDKEKYTEIPVSVVLDKVPYKTLSEYHFFSGSIDALKPNSELLTYKPNSELFTDYAKKLRFVWIPSGVKSDIVSENEPINLPVGSVLIKVFFYDEDQLQGEKKIIETRLMIRKEEGWIFANYTWNESQTEAFLDMEGGTVPITFQNKGETITTNYVIPNSSHCITCHSKLDASIPIGIKPIHLNYNYENENQLIQWMKKGFLREGNISEIQSVTNYADTSKPLNKRVRSYFDIQCASCHNDKGSAAYIPLHLDYDKTENLANMGVCIPASITVPGSVRSYFVEPKSPETSTLYYLMGTNNPLIRMPRLGRTIIHKEGLDLVEEWIHSIENDCM